MFLLEIAFILIGLTIAFFVSTSFFSRHTKRNDETIKELNMIFFKGDSEKKTKKN